MGETDLMDTSATKAVLLEYVLLVPSDTDLAAVLLSISLTLRVAYVVNSATPMTL